MLTSVLVMLTVFYAGAIFATGRSWLGVWQGAVGYSGLRDLTGIGDRAVLRRLFGLTLPDGRYRVTFSEIARHRRMTGIILADLPVQALFLAALLWASSASTPAASAVICAAGAYAMLLGCAAVAILAGDRRALIG